MFSTINKICEELEECENEEAKSKLICKKDMVEDSFLQSWLFIYNNERFKDSYEELDMADQLELNYIKHRKKFR